MNKVQLVWHGYHYFPYEREFAKREVKAVFRKAPREVKGGLEVSLNGKPPMDLKRLTYFQKAILPDGTVVIPDQARLEASVPRNGDSRRGIAAAPLSTGRQMTRYSAHGLHEYRGKFNPQVVRAIGNMLGLSGKVWVLDPFCGSGTTILECAHIGWNAVGVDLNPLAVVISNAKIQVIRAPGSLLQRTSEDLARRLRRRVANLTFTEAWSERITIRLAGTGWRDRLPNFDYLASWFTMPVLAQIAVILGEIDRCASKSLASVFRVILSDLVRAVSLQDPGDFRIRRRKHPGENFPVIPMFLEAVQRKVDTIISAREAFAPKRLDALQQAFVADTREPLDWLRKRRGSSGFDGFDAAITSPPYATALPYIDTQRLSLCLLGLISSKEIMTMQRALVGTREIGNAEREKSEAALVEAQAGELPSSVTMLCRRMLELASGQGNGFRRRNMPALVYRYFSDMTRTFRSVHSVTRPGGIFALVVGRNQTLLAGKMIVIDTPRLLGEVASLTGWHQREIIELDTYQRFDIHRRNSIKTECLLLLEKKERGAS